MAVAVALRTLPWTNLFHILTSPINIFVAPFKNKGALEPIANLETAEQLGVKALTHFPWPRLVNVDACTECGRCQAVCPAYAAKQPLNPKKLVLDLRGALTADGGTRQRTGAGDAESPQLTLRPRPRQLVGDVIKHETLWSCTTCYACVHECPVLIEQVDDIVDMRRYLALDGGRHPVQPGDHAHQHRARRQPVEAAQAQARRLDARSRLRGADHGEPRRGRGGGRALVGGLRRRV